MNRIIPIVLIIGLLVYSLPIHAEGKSERIEVYHIDKAKVVKEIPITAAINKEAENYLSNIEGIYKKINPIPRKGFIVRIPLRPPIKVQNQWIHTLADEMNIFYPVEEDPYIMIFDDENNVYFFTIDQNNSDLSKMAEYLGITP
ncbi:hypothetical protein RRV45_04765 [Bacillus sp. DTU_2020_1000418_1_SI_GHA_SEK_038]|uniref:hypothetical protein n=1 Tax=Bacillus sp. DTU_2020_1000418_1_SI_GHA_SEK_038 TaxID=3077585 RepID=UPI0028F0FFAF|nr:hypothetical protein [Bacillus sp. DTU_2020_1000418_1_SI_GHA_SEK_038]WNS76324.1 hypothetical protein RRV45_04765 [Bacillus sp. DTU_2020_1000418_1_SI_GHA_SEK_038]